MKEKDVPRQRLFAALLVAVGAFTLATPPVFSEESQPALGSAAGMTIHVDPKTGALLAEPVPGSVLLQLTPQLRDALNTSHQGLAEVPSSVPGGGFKLDLQGRFQNPLIVTIDADGKLRIRHLHEAPAVVDTP